MDLTNQRRLLNAMTTGFLVVAGVGVAWSLGGIGGSSGIGGTEVDSVAMMGRPGDRDRDRASIEPTDPPVQHSSDTSDADLLNLAIQKSLYDPPKPAVVPTPVSPPATRQAPSPAPPKQPSLNWTLEGTLIDAERSVAILTDATGNSDIRSVGEQVELTPAGVLVRKITPDQVVLELGGKQSTLRLQSSFQSAPVGADERAARRRNR